jgi:ligand-binding sensor domain-containing protein/signal transduction histidine kinase
MPTLRLSVKLFFRSQSVLQNGRSLEFPFCVCRYAFFCSKIAFLLLSTTYAFSQSIDFTQFDGVKRQLRFDRISIDPKFSDFIVYTAVQDSLGFLWFGTLEGLYRYDGYEFMLLDYPNSDGTRAHDRTVRVVMLDARKNLWYGSANGVLAKLDHETGVLTRITPEQRDASNKASKPIYALCEDTEHNIWIGTSGDGVFRFDVAKNSFSCFAHDPADNTTLSNNVVNAICRDAIGNLWVGTDSCLNILNPRTGKFTRSTHDAKNKDALSNSSITALCRDAFDTMWVGTRRGFNKALSATSFLRFDTSFVRSILRVENTLWVGRDDGLTRLDLRNLRSESFGHDPLLAFSLSNSQVRNVFLDNSGILWFGTLKGISKLNRGSEQFQNFILDPPLAKTAITVMCSARNGDVLIGTYDGLLYFDIQRRAIEKFDHDPSDNQSLPSNFLTAIIQDRRSPDVFWIGTWDHGIIRFDYAKRQFSQYVFSPKLKDNNVVYALFQDSLGFLWGGALKEGLLRFDPLSRTFEHFGFEEERVRVIAEESVRELWVGTERGGLHLLNTTTRSFRDFKNDPNNPNSINDNSAFSMSKDGNGNLWVGTFKGLSKYDRKRNVWQSYSTANGMPEDRIVAIVKDRHGTLWLISARRGIVRLDPATDSAISFQAADGLLSNEFGNSWMMLPNGDVAFNYWSSGFVVFSPSNLHKSAFVPPVYLTGMKIFERGARSPSIPTSWKPIVLPYDSNFFSLNFVALDYGSPEQNRYQYKLEGVDDDWVHTVGERTAKYTKVEHGEYVFKVRGAGSSGAWNAFDVSVPLTITPHWANTWWFRSLITVVLVAIGIGAYRYRVNNLMKIERTRSEMELKQEKDRLRIASDLHDDIGSNLGTIAIMSDMVLMQNGIGEHARQRLATIGRNARNSAEALRDIVFAINKESDTFDNMLLRMKDEAAAKLSQHDLSFVCTCKNIDRIGDIGVRRNLLLIYKEILQNIAKSAHATQVSITIEEDNGSPEQHSRASSPEQHGRAGSLTITIHDNGCGFDEQKLARINGIDNMRRRAEEIGGKFEIRSKVGEGTIAKLHVKIM